MLLFWVVNASRNEKSCLQFLIPTAVFHMLLTKIIVRGWLRFLSRRDGDFQKFIFIKLRPTYKKAGTRVSYFLIYYRKIIVPLKSQCRNSGLPLVSY